MTYKNNDSNPSLDLKSIIHIHTIKLLVWLKIIHSNTLYYEYIFVLIYLNLFRINMVKPDENQETMKKNNTRIVKNLKKILKKVEKII